MMHCSTKVVIIDLITIFNPGEKVTYLLIGVFHVTQQRLGPTRNVIVTGSILVIQYSVDMTFNTTPWYAIEKK